MKILITSIYILATFLSPEGTTPTNADGKPAQQRDNVTVVSPRVAIRADHPSEESIRQRPVRQVSPKAIAFTDQPANVQAPKAVTKSSRTASPAGQPATK